MIASTRHSYKLLNTEKKQNLLSFIEEYSRVANIIVKEIWRALPEDLSLPLFQDYKKFNIETFLSARVLQCAANQATGIVKSCIEKQRRLMWVQKNKNSEIKDVKFSAPKEGFISPELNANCANIKLNNCKHFAGFVKLSSLGISKVFIPIDKTSQFSKWNNLGAKLSTFIKLFKYGFQLSWKLDRMPKPQGDKIVGVDQGYNTVVTFSDGQTTPNSDGHGHSLKSIIDKLSRKKKGSKSFARAQTHRKNFINWSINQLNFSNIKEVRLEKVINIRKNVRSSRKMSHWSNPEIRDKIIRQCELLEVPVVEQSCSFRSQRCSSCGSVRKANRNGKYYKCKHCGFVCDADKNAANNHKADLPDIPINLRGHKLNLGNGFFWKPEGLFNYDGSELIVPNSQVKIFQ